VTPTIRATRARFRAYLPEAEAEAEFRIAEGVFADLELPFFLALTRFEAAARLLAADREPEAEPLLTAAAATFERLQATPWLDRVEQLSPRALTRSTAASEPSLPT
jgi:hypothetical protein